MFQELSNEIVLPCYVLYLTHASCKVLVHSVNAQLKQQNSIYSQHTWHRSECLTPLWQSLLVLIHISWSGFIPHYRQGEQKTASGTTWLCLETTSGELPCAVGEELTEVEQMRLMGQAQVTHRACGDRGLWATIPLEVTWSCFSRENSSQTERKDITHISPNKNTSPSCAAGFSYLFCLWSSCPLVG